MKVAVRSWIKNALSPKQRFIANSVLNRGNARTLLKAGFFSGSGVHQISGDTYFNRYPAIFDQATNIVGKPDPKILSFGCSTGEEVLSLRSYFPKARITGAEIDPERLKSCRALAVDDAITFIVSRKTEISAHGPYDAIFAMAVLQRLPHMAAGEGLQDLDLLYPFEEFDAQLKILDQVLYVDGIIFIKNTQYRFVDTSIAHRYEVVLKEISQKPSLPVFNKHSKILPGETYVDVAFRKLANASD